MPDAIQSACEALRPTTKTNVMELLQRLGHDVSHWQRKADGSPVDVPAANPAYCYDWAFGSPREGIVLCVWYRSIVPGGDRLVYHENMRTLDNELTAIASSSERSSNARDRARQQATRARHFDSLVRTAFGHLLPIHFIINDGDQADRDHLGETSSHARQRALDSMQWYVHRYDERTGDCEVVRGIKPTHDPADHAIEADDKGPEDARQLAAIKIRRGQADFRERLLSAWSRRCVVTECRVLGLLEASHIKPHAKEADYQTSNGLLLRADIHTLYDLDLLSVDQFMRVHLAEELQASEYQRYDGKKIDRRPDRSADAPSIDALAHRHARFMDKAIRHC
jgi:hypothetical protein